MIHPTAIVSDSAHLGNDISIGPYAVIEDNAEIEDNCSLGPHVHIFPDVHIGSNTSIHTGAVLGDEPQDHHFEGQRSYTYIGQRCTVREHVTVHRGTQAESSTVIGDNVMLMGLCHVAHNCEIKNNVQIANNALLAGHVEVGESAFLSGAVLVHQFVRIGRLGMVGGGARVSQDLPPFCLFAEGIVRGPNSVGLKRSDISTDTRKAIRQAVKTYFFKGLNRENALETIRQEDHLPPEVQEFTEFIENTQRGILPGS